MWSLESESSAALGYAGHPPLPFLHLLSALLYSAGGLAMEALLQDGTQRCPYPGFLCLWNLCHIILGWMDVRCDDMWPSRLSHKKKCSFSNWIFSQSWIICSGGGRQPFHEGTQVTLWSGSYEEELGPPANSCVSTWLWKQVLQPSDSHSFSWLLKCNFMGDPEPESAKPLQDPCSTEALRQCLVF